MTEFKIPVDNSELIVVVSQDLLEDLIKAYNQIYNKINGKTISDVALVYNDLTTWLTMEQAELKIPYKYARQRKESVGHRIWYMSQPKHQLYYGGNFFDLKVSKTSRRTIRRQCKLSDEAVKFFSNPLVRENKPC